jgi:hypothetical protein
MEQRIKMLSTFFCNLLKGSCYKSLLILYFPNRIDVCYMFGIVMKKFVFSLPSANQMALLLNFHSASLFANKLLFISSILFSLWISFSEKIPHDFS